MTRYVLALDQGTTSSRAILFDESGAQVAMAAREFRQIFPQPGWVEHDPEEIWETQLEVARRVLAEAGVAATDLAALGITNQRETTVLWERETGRPVHNAVVWQDRRTAALCEAITASPTAALIRERTGLVIDAYFSATKLQWLLDRVPGARERAERGELAFGTVDAWLLWRLTGGRVHATDVTNASRTMLYDIRRGAWDPEILAALRIPAALLPAVHPSSHRYGETEPALLGAAVPVGGMAGDQQAATFGQACLEPGMAKNTYGTGCFVLMNTGPRPVPSGAGLITTPLASGGGVPQQYALEGSIFVAGAAVQWLRDGLGIIRDSAETEALARTVPAADGVYVVPAFVGLGAPYWDMYARGAILGITRGTTAAHVARATLESIAFQTRDVIDAMERDAGIELRELRADGGAARNDLLMQVQADVLGRPVVRPLVTETTALGAAYLAGLAVGLWSGPEAVAAAWRPERTFHPAVPAAEREQRYAGWRRAVERVRGWAQD
ncbi:MAG TPA: glycerol kinase GlpK [Dehalococcoidia bacterium]